MSFCANSLLPIIAQRINYDPETGAFIWPYLPHKHARWIAKYAGKPAGRLRPDGRVTIGFRHNGTSMQVHAPRLAWYIVNGKAPSGEIDHIDGDVANNRIANLRDVSSAENSRNAKMSRKNTSGVSGVYWHKKTGKWHASVKINRAANFLGLFERIEDAAIAVRHFRLQNGFTERHGLPGGMS